MGTNCVPLVADLFLFCYERDLMVSLCDDKQADIIGAFNFDFKIVNFPFTDGDEPRSSPLRSLYFSTHPISMLQKTTLVINI